MLLIDIILGFVVLLILSIVITVIAHLWLGAPYVPTPWKVARKMVKFADLKGTETVYDLGAGDGRLLISVKQEHSAVQAKGCEFAPTIWLFGRFRIWWSGLDIHLFYQNALTQDLSDADCIFLYLFPGLMDKLEKRFDQELRPGTKVISYAFPFQNHNPIKDMNVPWLKGERKLRMYVW